MKFEALMAFWKMREMIKHQSCQTRTRIYDSADTHMVYAVEVHAGSMKANVLYRYTEQTGGAKSGMALVYADVLFAGFPNSDTDQLFIKNAKVSDLVEHVVK